MSAVKEPGALILTETEGGRILELYLTGKLATEDYENVVPTLERLVKTHRKLRILVNMHDFHGWTPGAMWEDLKFDVKHFHDIERAAIVGEKKWQQAVTAFCKPFTGAEVRYFDRADVDQARAWLLAP